MLWQKGWLETRFRLLFVLGSSAFLLALQHTLRTSVPTPRMKAVVLGMIAVYHIVPMIMVCAMLAGTGIDTQPTFQAAKGLHGSTLFTLSLPVSRLRLLAVRAAVGWLESVATIALFCWASWFMSPVLRVVATPAEMAEYAVTLIACGSALYFLSVLLAAFLDDQWRTWGTMIAAGAMGWISYHVSLPASIDIVQAIGKRSPLIAHTMPWPAMAFSITLAAIFFIAALKIVQTREY